MFVLNSIFTIGNYRFRGCNNVKIKKSILEYIDTAVISLPTQSVIKQKDNTYSSTKLTAHQFKQGDKVMINLGYNGKLEQEFIGFVSRVNIATPCTIECEGYSYQLRTMVTVDKSWKKVQLKDALAEIIKGTDIVLSEKIPEVELQNLKFDKVSGDKAIEYLKGLFSGAMTVFFVNNVLYFGLTYLDVTQKSIKHRIGWNVVSADNLKLRKADDVKVQVQFEFKKSTGEAVTISAGTPGGVVKKQTISIVSDTKKLKEIAEAALKKEAYDGYEGSYTGFLIPFVQNGYRASLYDKKYPERQGNYFVESVETTYGQSGGRRDVQIGVKLSDI